MKPKKTAKFAYPVLSIDSEWSSSDEVISLQCCVEDCEGKKSIIVFLSEKFSPGDDVIKSHMENNPVRIIQHNFQGEKTPWDVLKPIIFKGMDNVKNPKENLISLDLVFFYSPRDLEYLFGHSYLSSYYTQKIPKGKDPTYIIQKRSIFGRIKMYTGYGIITIRFRDLYGWSTGGLQSLMASVGIDSKTKSILDGFKSRMEIAVRDHFTEFMTYAINDIIVLDKIVNLQVKRVNQLMLDVWGIPIFFHFHRDTIPYTNGALVAAIFERFIHSKFQGFKEYNREIQDNDYFRFLYYNRRLGHLKMPDEFNAKDIAKVWDAMFNKNSFKESGLYLEDRLNTHTRSKYFDLFAFSSASIRAFSSLHTNNTGIYLAIVSGGRTNNESSSEISRDLIADVDCSSCYGSALVSFTYPIGVPFIYARSSNQSSISLKDFLDDYSHEMIDNLWHVVVSGRLSFDQDLVYSKLISWKEIVSRIKKHEAQGDEDEVGTSFVEGDFVLLRRQIKNGIITSDILEILKKVSTSKELKEWMNLDVVAACMWKKSDMVESSKDWISSMKNFDGEYYFDSKTQSIKDTRSRKWFPLKLADFVGPLILERKKIKSQMKFESDPVKILDLNAKQESYKRIINTLYGVLASPYFLSGNTCISNNITARARAAVWQLSKSLNSIQSITDGTQYSPQAIFNFKSLKSLKKPGFNVLSCLKRLGEHRYIEKVSLGGVDWREEYMHYSTSIAFKNMDALVLNHVENFWSAYNLGFKYELEHKVEHYASRIVFISKAHYALLTYDAAQNEWGKMIFKVRGAKRSKEFIENPIFKIMEAHLKGETIILESLDYQHWELTSIYTYVEMLRLKEKRQDVQVVKPGYLLVTNRRFQYHENALPLIDERDLKKREDRERKGSDFAKKLLTTSFQDVHNEMVLKHSIRMSKTLSLETHDL
jgi:hypothetical protein